MSTKAQITTAIDAKIRNKTPLVVKVEHADVEQLITDEMFPAPVVVEWNGTAPVSPITDIICSASLQSSDNIKFKVLFWKQGNTVFYDGYVESLSTSAALIFLQLITFPTTLYKPYNSSTLSLIINTDNRQIQKPNIFGNQDGITISAGLPPSTVSQTRYYFMGTYKVAN
jgi:hypothetical protein